MVKEAVDKDPVKKGWIRGFSWYHVFWDNRQLPTCASLDKYFPDRPVCLIHAEVHGAWVNSAAMKIMGIDENTPDMENGLIIRDEDGNPTGVLLEAAAGLATKYAFDFTPARRKGCHPFVHGRCQEAGHHVDQRCAAVLPRQHGQYLEVYQSDGSD